MDNIFSKVAFYRTHLLGALFLSFLSACSLLSSTKHSQSKPEPQNWVKDLAQQEWSANLVKTLRAADTELPKQLQQLIQDAMRHNQNLQKSAYRVQAAVQANKAVNSNLWPDARLRYGVENKDSNKKQSASIGVDWELDVWGKLSDARKASFADWLNQQELHRSAQQSLQVNVAIAWLKAIEAKQLLQFTQDNLSVQKQRLSQLERRLKRGLADTLDVRLSRNQVANLENRLWQNQDAYEKALRGLSVLVGRYPDTNDILPNAIPELSLPEQLINPHLLLSQRPDILAAEQRLMAQKFKVKEAKKRLLPSLTLSASMSHSVAESQHLWDLEEWIEQLSASLLQPIFRGGELKANAKRQQFQAMAALAEYKQVVLDAWLDVENLSAGEKHFLLRRQAVETAYTEAKAAEALTLRKYEQGLAKSFELLSAQNRSIGAEDAWIRIKISHYANRLRLHSALGQFLLEIPAVAEDSSS